MFITTKEDFGAWGQFQGISATESVLDASWSYVGGSSLLKCDQAQPNAHITGLKTLAEKSAFSLFAAIKLGINVGHKVMGPCDFVATLALDWAVFKGYIAKPEGTEYVSIFDNPFANGPNEVVNKAEVERDIQDKLIILNETSNILAFVTVLIESARGMAPMSHNFIIIRSEDNVYIVTKASPNSDITKMVMKPIPYETLNQLCRCDVGFLNIFSSDGTTAPSFVVEGIGIYYLN